MEEFSVDILETALQHGEMLVEIELPAPPPIPELQYTNSISSPGDNGNSQRSFLRDIAADDTCRRDPHCPGRCGSQTHAGYSRRAILKGKKDHRCFTEKRPDRLLLKKLNRFPILLPVKNTGRELVQSPDGTGY